MNPIVLTLIKGMLYYILKAKQGGKYLDRKKVVDRKTGKMRYKYKYKPMQQRAAHEVTRNKFEKVTKLSGDEHKNQIEHALQNGIHVSLHVLRDYPDLITKYHQQARLAKADKIRAKVKASKVKNEVKVDDTKIMENNKTADPITPEIRTNIDKYISMSQTEKENYIKDLSKKKQYDKIQQINSYVTAQNVLKLIKKEKAGELDEATRKLLMTSNQRNGESPPVSDNREVENNFETMPESVYEKALKTKDSKDINNWLKSLAESLGYNEEARKKALTSKYRIKQWGEMNDDQLKADRTKFLNEQVAKNKVNDIHDLQQIIDSGVTPEKTFTHTYPYSEQVKQQIIDGFKKINGKEYITENSHRVYIPESFTEKALGLKDVNGKKYLLGNVIDNNTYNIYKTGIKAAKLNFDLIDGMFKYQEHQDKPGSEYKNGMPEGVDVEMLISEINKNTGLNFDKTKAFWKKGSQPQPVVSDDLKANFESWKEERKTAAPAFKEKDINSLKKLASEYVDMKESSQVSNPSTENKGSEEKKMETVKWQDVIKLKGSDKQIKYAKDLLATKNNGQYSTKFYILSKLIQKSATTNPDKEFNASEIISLMKDNWSKAHTKKVGELLGHEISNVPPSDNYNPLDDYIATKVLGATWDENIGFYIKDGNTVNVPDWILGSKLEYPDHIAGQKDKENAAIIKEWLKN